MDLDEGSKPCLRCLDLKLKLDELQKLYEKKDRLSKLLKEYLCTKHSLKIKQEILPPDYDKRPTKDIEDNNYLRQRIVTLTGTVKKLIEEKQSVFVLNNQNKILIEDYENNQKNFKYANQQLHRQLQAVVEELENSKKLLTVAEQELAEFKKKKSRKKKAKDSRAIKEVISSLSHNSEIDIVADGEVKAEDIFYPTPVSSTVQSPATSVGSEFPTSTRSPASVAESVSSPAGVDYPPSPSEHPCDSSTKTVYLNDSDESITSNENCTITEENSTNREENCTFSEENSTNRKENSKFSEENITNREENCTFSEENTISKPSSIVKPITQENEMDKPDLLPTQSTLKNDNVFPNRTFTSKNIKSVNPFAFRQKSTISPAKLTFDNRLNPFKIKKFTPDNEILATLLSNLKNLSLKDREKISFSNKNKHLENIQHKLDTTSFNMYRDKSSFKQVIKSEKSITLSFPTDSSQKIIKLDGNPQEAFERLKELTEKSKSFEDFIKRYSSESKPESNLFMTALARNNTCSLSKFNGDLFSVGKFKSNIFASDKTKNSFENKFNFDKLDTKNPFLTVSKDESENIFKSGKNKNLPKSLFVTDESDLEDEIDKEVPKCQEKLTSTKAKLDFFTSRTQELTDESDLDDEINKEVPECQKNVIPKKSKLDLFSKTQKLTDESDLGGEIVKKVPKCQKNVTPKKFKLDLFSKTQKLTDVSDLGGEIVKKVPKCQKNVTPKKSKLDLFSKTQKLDESDLDGEIPELVPKSQKKLTPKKAKLDISASKTPKSTDESDSDERSPRISERKSPAKILKKPRKRSKIKSPCEDASDSEEISEEIERKKRKSDVGKKSTQNVPVETNLSTTDETESEFEENTAPKKIMKTRSSRKKPNTKNAQEKQTEKKNEDLIKVNENGSSDTEETVQKTKDHPVLAKKPKINTKKNKTNEKLRKSARLISSKLPEETKLQDVAKVEKSPPPKSRFPNFHVTSKGVKVHLPPESLDKRRKAAEIFKKPRPPKRIFFVPETVESKKDCDEEFDSILKDIQESYKPVSLLAPLNETSLDVLNSDEKCEEVSDNENHGDENFTKQVSDENNILPEILKPNEETVFVQNFMKQDFDKNNLLPEISKPNEATVLVEEETEQICQQKNNSLTDFNAIKIDEETDLVKNESAISNSTINSEECDVEKKNVDLPNTDEQIPLIEDDFDLSIDEDSEIESLKVDTVIKVDDLQTEKNQLFAYLDKLDGKNSDEPKDAINGEKNEDRKNEVDVSDLLSKAPFGFYSTPSETEESPQTSNNTEEAAKPNFNKGRNSKGKKKERNSEPTEALECEENALDCAWKYLISIKPKKIKNQIQQHNKAQLDQIEESLDQYMASDDVFLVLPKVVTQLHKLANHQTAKIFVKVLCDDKDVYKLFNGAKNNLDSTPIQDKILVLISAILVHNKTFLDDILSTIEGEMTSFKTSIAAEVNVSLGQIHTTLCKRFGLYLRTRTLIYDMFYVRQFRAYPAMYKMLSLWQESFPNHRKNDECLMSHTIAQICTKVPTIWNMECSISKLYRIKGLELIFSHRLGYCHKYGFSYNYDELFTKLVKNIEYEGNDSALVLLCKCLGFKYTCEAMKKEIYPILIANYESTGENLLAKIILTSGKICKGFPAMDTVIFVREYIKLVGQILHKNLSRLVCEASVEALSHVKKFDLDLIMEILWKWTPEGKKLSIKCVCEIRKIMSSRTLVNMKYAIDNLKNNDSEENLS